MNESKSTVAAGMSSSIAGLLRMGSTGNAFGALTKGAQALMEADLKMQANALESASEFAATSAIVVQSQLSEVNEQAQEQQAGDEDAAIGEICGGAIGLTSAGGSLGTGFLGVGSESDELSDLNEFSDVLEKDPAQQVTIGAQGQSQPASPSDQLSDEIRQAEAALAPEQSSVSGLEKEVKEAEDKIPLAKQESEAVLKRVTDRISDESQRGIKVKLEGLDGKISRSKSVLESHQSGLQGIERNIRFCGQRHEQLVGELSKTRARIEKLNTKKNLNGQDRDEIRNKKKLVLKLNRWIAECEHKQSQFEDSKRATLTLVEQERSNMETLTRSLGNVQSELDPAKIRADAEKLAKNDSEVKAAEKAVQDREREFKGQQVKLNEAQKKLDELQKSTDKMVANLKRQQELLTKLTNPVVSGPNGASDLDLSNIGEYKDVQEAVLKRMDPDDKKSLKASLEKAIAKAKHESDTARHAKGSHMSGFLQSLTQVIPSAGSGIGQQCAAAPHGKATVDGALAQVDGTVASQYDGGAQSLAQSGDSLSQAALQVAASIRG